MNRPERPASEAWLAERRAADTAAREPAAHLLDRLAQLFAADPSAEPSPGPASGPKPPVHVYDLGAGTGANRAYLEPRLGFATEWTILDHDPVLLRHRSHGEARRILAGIAGVQSLVTTDAHSRRLVSCSALLDVVTYDDLERLAQTLVRTSTPALLSLSVTGDVRFTPAEPADLPIASAFNAHQGRDGRAGPDAAEWLTARLRHLGSAVEVVATPWRLSATRDHLMMKSYVIERASVATEFDGGLGPVADRWCEHRLRDLDARRLTIQVDHVDLLALPSAVSPTAVSGS